MNDLLTRLEYKSVKNMIDRGELLYLTLSGSIAYGTNVENSDIDIRGIMKTPEKVLLGFQKYDQYEDLGTDTVIYTANKYLKLLLECNPNCVELMGTKEEHHLYTSPIGQLILDNYKMFLSQRIFYTFEGYAMAQLNRLRNALIRNSDTTTEKNKRLADRFNNMIYDFNGRYGEIPEGAMVIHHEKDLSIDVNLSDYSLKDLLGIFSEMNNTFKDYHKIKPGLEGLNKRNRKKTPEKLDKHAMHLVRLYIMSIEMGKSGEVLTYREKDKDFLLKIRQGYFRDTEGMYKEDFFDLVEDYKKELTYVKKETVLPVKADHDKIEAFVMEINRLSHNL